LPADEAPAGVRIPTLGQLYVNPRFRIADASSSLELASEECWARQPVRDDLQSFLIGFLTGPQVTDAPLLVLGHPGSGKSALTRVLAARLPPTDFLAVTVSLREVPADAELQTQVEYAVRHATGESVSWPVLARSTDGALPVLILDGFDELVQATGVTQSDYLEKVAAFQRPGSGTATTYRDHRHQPHDGRGPGQVGERHASDPPGIIRRGTDRSLAGDLERGE
jgi:hypothetical protein